MNKIIFQLLRQFFVFLSNMNSSTSSKDKVNTCGILYFWLQNWKKTNIISPSGNTEVLRASLFPVDYLQ